MNETAFCNSHVNSFNVSDFGALVCGSNLVSPYDLDENITQPSLEVQFDEDLVDIVVSDCSLVGNYEFRILY